MTKFLLYGQVLIEQHENYQKGSYRNRAHILSAEGVVRLSVPLRSGKNERQPITEVEIAYDEPWDKEMSHTLQSAYGNAPFAEHYLPGLLAIINSREQRLFALNRRLLDYLIAAMDLPPYQTTNEWVRSPNPALVDDLRGAIHPKKPRTDQNYRSEAYEQVFSDRFAFVANLSAVDLLLNCGPESRLVLQKSIHVQGS